MRKNYSIFALLATAGLALASCEKEETLAVRIPNTTPPDTNKISKAPYAEQVLYTHEHLALLGKALVLLQKDKRVRDIMYKEFDACKPGFENVLFVTLFEKAKAQGIDLEAEMNLALAKAGEKQTATNALLAFKGIEGVTWQPQIYIPNYAALKKANKVGRNETNAAPVFFTYAGEESIQSYQTYRADDSGLSVTKALVATEETTNTNEVMIIGLSETSNLHSSGPPVESGGPAAASKTKGGWSANIYYIGKTRALINFMSVKQHKESWTAGASEVAANGGVRWRAPGGLNPYNPPNNTPDVSRVGPNGALNDYDAGGYSVADWSRSEVGNKELKYVNFRLVDNWNPYWYPTPGYRGPVDASGDTAGFIIYEADAWPAGLKPAEWRLPVDFSTETVNIAVQYRS
uniref:hypothetical protein n=1 Tax=uncultured Hymenobacter sp. TaxID=170016 RepID=UPI0035C9FD52